MDPPTSASSASSSSQAQGLQVVVKFTTGSQSVFLCQWHHHSIADLLAAIRSQYSLAATSTPISAPIPADRVQFKLLHAGSVLAADSHPLALLKRQLLVTHSPLLASQAVTLPTTTTTTTVDPTPAPVPPLPLPLLEPPPQPEPAALFSLDDEDDDNVSDDDQALDHDENAPLHPDRPPTQPALGGVSPRPVNERLPLLRATAVSVPSSPSKHLSSTLSPRASPDSVNLIETVVVLCSISEASSNPDSPSSSSAEQQAPNTAATDTPRGFDALLTQGFSPADIHAFRRTFHQARGTSTASDTNRIRLEDAWVAGDHTTDHAQVAVTEQSTVKALVKGATLGYFLGVPMVLGVKEMARVDRRVVVGGVLGLVVNFGVGVLLWINRG